MIYILISFWYQLTGRRRHETIDINDRIAPYTNIWDY